MQSAGSGAARRRTQQSAREQVGGDNSFTVRARSSVGNCDVIREDLQITGPKYGCGEGACGACSVLIENRRVFSCSTPVREVAGKSITTIEGLASGSELHPLQQAFLDEMAFQCGYCTGGMIVAAEALLRAHQKPTDAQIIE